VKCLKQNAQDDHALINSMLSALAQGNEICEYIMFAFTLKEDTALYLWPLIELTDFPQFEETFIKFELLDKLKIYQIKKIII